MNFNYTQITSSINPMDFNLSFGQTNNNESFRFNYYDSTYTVDSFKNQMNYFKYYQLEQSPIPTGMENLELAWTEDEYYDELGINIFENNISDLIDLSLVKFTKEKDKLEHIKIENSSTISKIGQVASAFQGLNLGASDWQGLIGSGLNLANSISNWYTTTELNEQKVSIQEKQNELMSQKVENINQAINLINEKMEARKTSYMNFSASFNSNQVIKNNR